MDILRKNNFFLFNVECLIVILFLIISYYLCINGYSVLYAPDDRMIPVFLQSGHYHTHLLSTIFSYLLSFLYQYSPYTNWLSFFYIFILNIFFITSLYLTRSLVDFKYKHLLYLFLFSFFIYSLLFISITSLTVVGICLSILCLNRSTFLFFFILTFTFLLRSKLFISLAPLFLLLFTYKSRVILNKNFILGALFFIFIVFFEYLILSHNIDITEWHKFNKSISYYVNFDLEQSNNSLSPDIIKLIKSWYFFDSSIIIPKEIIFSTGVISRFEPLMAFNFSKLLNLTSDKYFPFLICSFFLVTFSYKHNQKFYFFIKLILFIYLLLLLSLRNVPYVSFPLVFLYLFINFLNLDTKKSYFFQIFLIFSIVYTITFTLKESIHSIKNFNPINQIESREKLFDDLNQALIDNNTVGIMPIMIPAIGGRYIKDVNILFYEEAWLNHNYQKVLPTGWVTHHPYFKYFLKQNFNNHDTIYERLITKQISFLTYLDDRIDDELNMTALSIYDQKYGCKHEFNEYYKNQSFKLIALERKCK